MGQIVYIDAWRTEKNRRSAGDRAEFFFDLGCPLSYLAAERIERTLGPVRWVPVATASVQGPVLAQRPDAVRGRAESLAQNLRLPLVWPDHSPAEARCALRAAAHAAELGVGARFALAASRLAYCGGFDLDDPETLAEAAAAAGLPLDECLTAAGDEQWDAVLETAAGRLRAQGVQSLPVFGVGGRLFEGDSGLVAASYVLQSSAQAGEPAAPPA